MANLWYLSPSDQDKNIGLGAYGSEMEQMILLADRIIPHLDRCGVDFHLADPDVPIDDRPAEANRMGADYYLALHSNAGGGGQAWGPIAFYYEAGEPLARKLAQELLATGQKNNRAYNVAKHTGLFELYAPDGVTCLLEVDFHDSLVGVDYLLNRREDAAKAIAKAIVAIDGKQWVDDSEELNDMYDTIAQVPSYAKATVQKLLDKGFLQGTADGRLKLTEEMCRILVIHDRAGLYD